MSGSASSLSSSSTVSKASLRGAEARSRANISAATARGKQQGQSATERAAASKMAGHNEAFFCRWAWSRLELPEEANEEDDADRLHCPKLPAEEDEHRAGLKERIEKMN